jgi:hypothetical protein
LSAALVAASAWWAVSSVAPSGIAGGANLGMTSYDRIDAVLKKNGWQCVDDMFRDRQTGELVEFDRIIDAMPEDILEDVVAAYGESTRVPCERE